MKLCSVVSLPLGVMLKTVPSPLAPPSEVVPYSMPSVACTRDARGNSPSAQRLSEQKAVECGQRPSWSDLEDCTVGTGSAIRGCPVQTPIRSLNQSGFRVGAVTTIGQPTKAMEGCQRPGWSDFENRAIFAGPAVERCPIEAA